MTPSERETQRRSFAYGNTKIEYEDITRETIDRESEAMTDGNAEQMTPSERETQRRSFAYGNTKIEYEDITRETIDRESEAMTDGNAEQDRNRTRE